MLAPTFPIQNFASFPMFLSACKLFQWYFVVTCPECKLGKQSSTIRRTVKREFAKHISIDAINVSLKSSMIQRI